MLYHKDLGFPKSLKLTDIYLLALDYSAHSKKEAERDRYGKIKLPSSVNVKVSQIIEVETFDNRNPFKILVRLDYSSEYDICMAIIIDKGRNFVKTLWLNSKEDIHITLDESKYTKF